MLRARADSSALATTPAAAAIRAAIGIRLILASSIRYRRSNSPLIACQPACGGLHQGLDVILCLTYASAAETALAGRMQKSGTMCSCPLEVSHCRRSGGSYSHHKFSRSPRKPAFKTQLQFDASLTNRPLCRGREARVSCVAMPSSCLCGFSKYDRTECAIVQQPSIGLPEYCCGHSHNVYKPVNLFDHITFHKSAWMFTCDEMLKHGVYW